MSAIAWRLAAVPCFLAAIPFLCVLAPMIMLGAMAGWVAGGMKTMDQVMFRVFLPVMDFFMAPADWCVARSKEVPV